jgi:hypothetical protein
LSQLTFAAFLVLLSSYQLRKQGAMLSNYDNLGTASSEMLVPFATSARAICGFTATALALGSDADRLLSLPQ